MCLVVFIALSISRFVRHSAKQCPHVLQVYNMSASFLDGFRCPSARPFISSVLPFDDHVSVLWNDWATVQ